MKTDAIFRKALDAIDSVVPSMLTLTVDTWFVGSASADVLTGTALGDLFAPHAGNDVINGLAGTDAVRLDGNRAGFSIQRTGQEWQVTDRSGNGSGSDRLISIERLLFDDQQVALQPLARATAPAYAQTNGFLFDAVFYLLDNPELVPVLAPLDALSHYLNHGAAEGRTPNGWFDAAWYANRWDDLRPLNLDAATLFQHYNLFGVWEGRAAGPAVGAFDGNRYLADNPDVAAYVDAFIGDFLGSRTNGAIAHFIIYGADEGRSGFQTSGAPIDLGFAV